MQSGTSTTRYVNAEDTMRSFSDWLYDGIRLPALSKACRKELVRQGMKGGGVSA